MCKEVTDIYYLAKTLGTNRSTHKMVDPSELVLLIDGLFDGAIKSTDDIASFMSKESLNIVTKNFTYGEALITSIKNLCCCRISCLIFNQIN